MYIHLLVQRNSLFPRQEELYDCYRMVYLENKKVAPEQLAGAATFKVNIQQRLETAISIIYETKGNERLYHKHKE